MYLRKNYKKLLKKNQRKNAVNELKTKSKKKRSENKIEMKYVNIDI